MTSFSRFAVVHRDSREPVEGCVYSDYFKAKKRLHGLSNPDDYEVSRVALIVPSCAQLVPAGPRDAEQAADAAAISP